MSQFLLADLAEQLGAELHGDGAVQISSIATIGSAGKGQISFLANSKYRSQLETTNAEAVIIQPGDLEACPTNALVLDNPYLGYAKLAQIMDTTPKVQQGNATVDPSAEVHPTAILGANAVISAGAKIAANCQVGANTFIGENTEIGENTKLWANVTVYHQVRIGQNCLVHSGAVIGADGFGFANDKGEWIKIPQLGGVSIGNNVEVGANTTIDRGALSDTVIGNNVILDNQLQIAHNVELGDGVAMAGCTVIGGSTKVGKGCTIAGACAINGHLDIAENVHITGMSMITKDIKAAGVYSSGMPIMDNKDWRKTMARFKQLDTMHQRLKALEVAAKKQQASE